MSPLPQLPQDIVNSIIALAPSDSLHACALTAISFVQSSQRRIFRSVSLGKMPDYDRMMSILDMSPHLGEYVKDLALYIAGLPANWEALAFALSTMTELERLTIIGNTVESASSCLSLRWHPWLFDLLSLPSLRCVGLDDLYDVPPSLITDLLETVEEVSLAQLFLARDAEEEYENGYSGSDNFFIPTSHFLWHLAVHDDCEELLPFLLSPRRIGYFRNLSRLSLRTICISEDHRRDLESALAACAASLTRLEIEYTNPFVLPALPALCHLELRIHADILTIVDAYSFPETVLIALEATPNLNTIALAIRERPMGQHSFDWGLLPISTAGKWQDLDHRLVKMHRGQLSRKVEAVQGVQDTIDSEDGLPLGKGNAAHFPSPRFEVRFSLLYLDHYEEDRYSKFASDMKDRLPAINEAGLTTFCSGHIFQHPMDKFSRNTR
ncbi:hypothetical protein R3P38DRAFT_2888115 [Favolaschia claudopus]|uniref:F-box domain-containing protein n=1 Tax=Favolaschia claudopus TaxID=2862362 RepID=A0AAW0CTW8_9AGAR